MQLEHWKAKLCDGVVFEEQNTFRLYCEPSERKKTLDDDTVVEIKYQQLLIGQCPRCNEIVMGWVGMDHDGVFYFPITPIKNKNHDRWYLRAINDIAHYFDKDGVDIVKGSSHQIPYQLKNVPVFR